MLAVYTTAPNLPAQDVPNRDKPSRRPGTRSCAAHRHYAAVAPGHRAHPHLPDRRPANGGGVKGAASDEHERDGATAASGLKLGDRRLARLGHCPCGLDARKAVDVDFTDPPHVSDSHAYSKGRPLRNGKVEIFFHKALNGEFADAGLPFGSGRTVYKRGQRAGNWSHTWSHI